MTAVRDLNTYITTEFEQPETILVVDDSRAQRRLVSTHLGRWGFRVIEAASGEEALEICKTESPDLVVSDWMMPGMNGLELCRAYRALRGDRYGYFILLTSKSDKGEIVQGLDVGADDFLTKPFNAAELRARIRAGHRIIAMERDKVEATRLVTETLAKLQETQDAIDRDLIEARKLQQSLVRERFCQFKTADVALMLHPAGHVGGDLVGVFPVNDDEIGIYALDVSGHGIASALLTVRLAGQLSGTSPTQNIALQLDENGQQFMRDPADVVSALNELILDEIDTEHYFTILIGRVSLKTGKVTLTQAGHPHPAVQRKSGEIEFIGTGGLPVGLINGAEYTEFDVHLSPGDRLFLGSDGITECEAPDGTMLDDDGVKDLLIRNENLKGQNLFEALMWDLTEYAGEKEFADDISGVLLEYHGDNRNN